MKLSKQTKKNQKLVQELYDYSRTLEMLPPSGEQAKLEVAKEIHNLAIKLFKNLEKNNEETRHATCLMLLEMAEQMLLDKIDDELTVEEMFMY